MSVPPALPARLAAHVRQAGLLAPGARVLVALSGGLDSVCLLHLLRFHPPVASLSLHAAHFDHALRPGSARDAEWVRGLCRAWGVPLTAGRAAGPLRGEAAARLARYRFLEEAAAGVGAGAILTAHHADDQLETLLFRLARGTGARGLRGIPARRGPIVRPLLPFRRAALAAYARGAGLGWREDESNRLARFSRNRIRHLVLPALEAGWPDAAPRLLRLAEFAAAVERMWRLVLPGLVSDAEMQREPGRVSLARGVVQEYHPLTRARVLRELAHQLGSPLDRAATRAAVRFAATGESGTAVRLGGGLYLQREFDRLVLGRSAVSAAAADRPLLIAAPAASTGRARIGGTWFDVSWGPRPPAGDTPGASATFDPAGLRFPLELRGWQPGDRIRLGYGTKKLKKLFAERRIPRSRRAAVPILAEQAGLRGVLWVAGVVSAIPAAGDGERWHITVRHGESG